MAQLLGLISNDPQALCCALHSLSPDLDLRIASRGDSWGIGYYQQGRALLHTRPTEPTPGADVIAEINERASDLVLAHLQPAGPTTAKLETTQPFRYGQLLFTQIGALEGVHARQEQLVAQLPDFLARARQGESDAELLFLTLLGLLHAEAGGLEPQVLNSVALRSALRAALSRLPGDSVPADAHLGILLADGDRLVASAPGEHTLAYRLTENVPSCPACLSAGRPPVRHHLRFTAIASRVRDGAEGWRNLKRGQSLVVERDMGIEIGAL